MGVFSFIEKCSKDLAVRDDLLCTVIGKPRVVNQ
ncbi:MAG: hypothetical protein JWQ85_1995 [Mucilaginibacter sp.]|nr:hypothetical protein [Mucilaginibacter sp.]